MEPRDRRHRRRARPGRLIKDPPGNEKQHRREDPMRRITLSLLAGFALTVGFSLETQAADPVGKFAGATLTVSRWAGDPWTAAQVKAAEAWSTATGGKVTIDAIPYENLHDKDALEMANRTFDIMY